MPILARTHFHLAVSFLRKNRVRSFLTCLGIAVGVASIVLILSLMGSINNLISNQVQFIGSDLIVVRPATHKDTVSNIVTELTTSSQYLKSNLSLDDIDVIKKNKSVSAVAPLAISSNTLSADKTVESGTVLGTTSNFTKIQHLPIKSGSFLPEDKDFWENYHQKQENEAEESDQQTPDGKVDLTTNSAVVGHQLAKDLFGTTEAVGRTFSLLGQKFFVSGVLAATSDPINFNNVNFDTAVIVNIFRLKALDDNLQIQQINIKSKTTDEVPEVAKSLNEELIKKKSGDNNFSVAYGDQISHPAGSLMSIISSILTLVAYVSLIVGGIGIMNIMLVSVAERTHEIGIRKAVGASSSNIFSQFLFESLTLSILGGLLGLILGYILTIIISIFTPFAPYVSWQILLITFGTSLFIGVIFGLYPAIKASRKNPIDSLKSFS